MARVGDVVWWAWVTVALLFGTLVSIAVSAWLFLDDICMSGLSYIADRRTPADDSLQGRICGASDHATWLEEYASFSIILAGLVGLVAVVVLWRTGRGRLQAVGALLYVFAAPTTTALLALPPNDCTAEEKATSGYECGRYEMTEDGG